MHRRSMRNVVTGLALGVASLGAFGACGGTDKKEVVMTPEPAPTPVKPDTPIQATVTPAPTDDAPPPSQPIYFDFDSYTVAETSRAELERVAQYLQKHAGATVTISGHTDDRGTTEYNLMLGDQRAKAAHDYLVRLGIDPLRIKTISFGEERPAVQGQGEEVWSKNRRDEFNTNSSK